MSPADLAAAVLQGLVGPALVALLPYCLRLVRWYLAAKAIRDFNAALAAAPTEEARQIIRSNPPPPPPDVNKITTIVVLLLSGLALAGALAEHRPVIAKLLAPEERCPHRCPRGEECIRGVCGKLSEDGLGPQSAALYEGSPMIDSDPWPRRSDG